MTNRFLTSQNMMSPLSTPRHQTYNEFRKSKKLFNPKERISKHYSSLLKQDQWDLKDEDDVLQKIFTEEMRSSKRRNLCLWAIITGIIFMYISFLLSYFWRQWTTECIRQLSVWLAVYEGIIILQLIRSLFLLRVWKVSRDPAYIQVKVDFFWSIIFLAEIGWYTYGNTFIYTSEIQFCSGVNEQSVDAYALWISTLIIICWGYCLMVYVLGIIVFAIGLCCVYRSWNLDLDKHDSDTQHRNLSNVPILSTMETYRYRRYEHHNRASRRAQSLSQPLTAVDGSNCGLCLEIFKLSEIVLDCHIGHVFH